MNKLWLELTEMVSVTRLNGLNGDHVINAFMANYLGALVLMRLHDIEAAQLLRDPNGAKLNGFSNTMSDPNFWAYSLLFSRDKYVKAKLGAIESERLYTMAGRITETGARKLMQLLQTQPNAVNWDQAYYTLALLRERFSIRSTYLDRVAPILRTWIKRSNIEQSRAVSAAFQYLLQSDPKSRLLPRLRELAQTSALSAGVTGTGFQGFFRIAEDGEGAVAGGTSAANIGTANGGGGAASNSIITPPGYQAGGSASNNTESPVGTKWSKSSKEQAKELLGKLYKKKLPPKRGATGVRLSKLKGARKLGNKIIRKKRRDFLPRQFKDPELNSMLGDNSDVRAA